MYDSVDIENKKGNPAILECGVFACSIFPEFFYISYDYWL